MGKIVSVGVWFSVNGDITSINVERSSGDAKLLDLTEPIPDEVLEYMRSKKDHDEIRLSNGRKLAVWFD